MDIYTLDGFEKGEIIEAYSSVVWNMQFYGQSDFQLIVPGTARNVRLLTRGTLLVRAMDVLEDGFRNVMIIRKRTIRWDVDYGWVLTLSGPGLKSIVGRRVIWKQLNLCGTVEAGIRQAITDNIIDPELPERAIQDFVLAPAVGITDTWETQAFGKKLDEWLAEVGQTYGIGWDVVISNGKYVFELLQGTDRTINQSVVDAVVFSPEYDNLAEASLEEDDEQYFNAGIVGGEGEGTDQKTAVVGTASGLDRIEAYIDGSGVSSNGEIITLAQYITLLETFGQEQLANVANVVKYDGKIVNNTMYALGEDYFLGDIVTIQNDYGIEMSCRISEMIYAIDETGESLVPTFEAIEGGE